MDENNNTIVETEETTEMETQAEEEIVETGSGKGAMIAAIVGLTALAGGLLGKFVVKPAVAKIKALKRKKNMIDAEAEDSDVSQDECNCNSDITNE